MPAKTSMPKAAKNDCGPFQNIGKKPLRMTPTRAIKPRGSGIQTATSGELGKYFSEFQRKRRIGQGMV